MNVSALLIGSTRDTYICKLYIFNFLQHIVRIVIVITSVLHHIHVSVLMAGREMIACKVTTDGYIPRAEHKTTVQNTIQFPCNIIIIVQTVILRSTKKHFQFSCSIL